MVAEMEKRNEQMREYARKIEEEMQKSMQEAFKAFDKVIPSPPLIQVVTSEPAEKKSAK
jgi:hypothetical protein